MKLRAAVAGLLAIIAVLVAPLPAFAHNVTFRATVTVAADGTVLDVYVDDVIRNPVPDAAVTVTAGGGISAVLTETEPGQYVGALPRPVQTDERLTVQVQVGAGNDTWSGSGQAAVGDERDWILVHQHGVDGRTFSVVMTSVFGALLAVIAVYEIVRLRRRRMVSR